MLHKVLFLENGSINNRIAKIILPNTYLGNIFNVVQWPFFITQVYIWLCECHFYFKENESELINTTFTLVFIFLCLSITMNSLDPQSSHITPFMVIIRKVHYLFCHRILLNSSQNFWKDSTFYSFSKHLDQSAKHTME